MELYEPGRALYVRVRGAFISKGFTLARWCKENAVVFTTARSALIGSSNSPEAIELRRKIIKDARL